MTGRAQACVAVLVTAGLLPAPARAQDQVDAFVGRTVAEIRIEVAGQPQMDSSLLALVDIQVGQPLSLLDIRETMDHFGQLDRFDDVRLLAADGPAGLIVTVALEPRLPIERLAFEGPLGLPESELQRRVRDLYGGLPPATVNLRNVEQAVERALNDEGYLTARATADMRRSPGLNRAELVVTVAAGPRTVIGQLAIENASPLSERQIEDRTGALPGRPYRPRALANALAGIRDDLSGLGYYSAFANSQVSESADRSSVDLTLVVSAGPRIRVEWGGDPRPGGDVDDLVPIRREGLVDEDLLEDADRLVRQALRRDGYREAEVYHTSEPRGGELVITFRVTRGRRYRLARVDVPAGLSVAEDVFRDAIGLGAGDPVDDERVLQGLQRVVFEYHQQGFYAVEAEPAYTEDAARSTPGEAWLVLHPTITEGPRGVLRTLAIAHTDDSPMVPESELRAVMRSRPGEPYSVAAVYYDRLDLETLYQNRGFRTARVEVQAPEFADDGAAVDLTLRVTEGPQTIVGQITVVGNRRVSEATILERIAIRVGEPLGPAAINETRRQLAELGMARASFSEQPRLSGDNRAHVILSVDEAAATTLGYGGGVEAGTRPRLVAGRIEDIFEVAPRGFIEIARRHIGGRDRTVSFFGRVSLKRASIEESEDSGGGVFEFIEYRTTVAYRARRAFNTDAEVLFGLTSEQATRTNFNFLRRAVNAEILRRVTPTVSVTGRYALDFTKLFDELILEADRPTVDRLFPQVRLSTLSTGAVWDRRDSLVSPTRGTFVTADVESALTAIGSEVDYVKAFFQVLRLTPLSESRRFVLVTRAQLGLARAAQRDLPDSDDGEPGGDSLDDLPASQRFFAGGGTTVRGFQLDRLGVPEILNSDGLSNGGNAVVVLNAEIRTRIGDLFGRRLVGVTFVDGGNVFRRAGDVHLGRLRGTAGFGVRWDSPLGPLRLDVGFKMDRMVIGGRPEKGWELHFSIGEAF
jgi:outer membrane protein assembly factor BamA